MQPRSPPLPSLSLSLHLLTLNYELSWIVDKVLAVQAPHVALPLLLPALLVSSIESHAQALYKLGRTISIFLKENYTHSTM